ncbi:hypothetical protein [Cognatishimia activa]|uniref:hypothetical protein n=1 Tax=Cognatishimia activa TaxID=1715691 RepID=UPI00222E6A9D|nr:hypothetical protein [Cognatishimia activa]UZD90332.1 hypothetical protein M0D42_12145 [Cognatishimia activa]
MPETTISPFLSAAIGVAAALSVKGVEVLLARVFKRSDKLDSVRDADVTLLKQVVFEVRDLSKDYWCANGRDEQCEGALTGRLLFLGHVCDELFSKRLDSLRSVQVCLNRLDSACTSGQFGTNSRKSEPFRCSQIEKAAYTLAYEVAKQRRKL